MKSLAQKRHLIMSAFLAISALACSPTEFEVKAVDAKGVVCDPFGGGAPSNQHGLMGNIFYLNDTQPLYDRVNDYFTQGHKMDATLVLSELAVPTRRFEQGFFRKDGSVLKREDGSVLMEKFALKMASNIKLTTGDRVGYKQFAVLADDGAVFTIRHQGATKRIVDMDRVQNTTLGCGANEAIAMDRDTVIPMQMEYFQGPRYHIALMLLWKDASSATPDYEPLCGQGHNDMYFDSNNGSTPQQAYLDLLARGWRPLKPENYYLGQNNPCAQ